MIFLLASLYFPGALDVLRNVAIARIDSRGFITRWVLVGIIGIVALFLELVVELFYVILKEVLFTINTVYFEVE